MESELTVAILREIRDEIRGTNTRIDTLERSLILRIDAPTRRLIPRTPASRSWSTQCETSQNRRDGDALHQDVTGRHEHDIKDLKVRVGQASSARGRS